MGPVIVPAYVDVPYLKRQDEIFVARVWTPPQSVDRKAVIVDVHGGAWCDRDRKAGYHYDQQLASQGFVVVAVDFRCGPQYCHPDASTDIAAAVHWARLRAEELVGHSAQVLTIGSSSGGHLGLLAALRPQLQDEEGTELWIDGEWVTQSSVDGRVDNVAAFWAPVDPLLRYRYANLLDTRLGRRLSTNTVAYFCDEDAMHDASITRIMSEEPPAHIPNVWFARAGNDKNVPSELVDQLARTYRAAGGSFWLEDYPKCEHGFGHADSEHTQQFVKDLVFWIDSTL